MKLFRSVIASVFLSSAAAFGALVAGAQAEGFVCPNERATIVAAHSVELGPFDGCARYVSLFGLEIVIGNRRCPATVLFHPSHGECQGKKSEGERCVGNGTVNETAKDCSCVARDNADLGVTSEHCACNAPAVTGYIQHSETRACPEEEPPEEREESGPSHEASSAWGAR